MFFLQGKQIAQAQQIPLSHLNIHTINEKDGFLSNGFHKEYKDSKGFLWFCCDFLQRYDGYRFKTYFTKQDGYVFLNLLEDKQNVLWIGTVEGLIFKYNRLMDKFLPLKDSIVLDGQKLPIKGKMQIAPNGDLFIFNLPNYIVRYRPNGKVPELVHLLKPYFGLLNDYWQDVDEKGNLYCSNTDSSFYRVNLLELKVYSKQNNPYNEIILNQKIGKARIIPGVNNIVWIQKWSPNHPARNIIQFNLSTGYQKIYYFPYKNKNVYDSAYTWIDNVLIDRNKQTWLKLGENVGLARYNISKDNFDILYTQKNAAKGLEATIALGSASTKLFQNNDDIFYTGNGGKSVQYFSPYLQCFKTFNNQDAILSIEPKKEILYETIFNKAPRGFIEAKDGCFYVVLNGYGLVKYNADFSVVTKINLPVNTSKFLYTPFTTNGTEIYLFDDFGTLIHYNIYTKAASILPLPQNNKRRIGYRCYVDKNESVWLGHVDDEGISRFDFKTKKYEFFKIRFFPSNATNNIAIIKDIIPEGERYLWLSVGNRGIQLFDKETKTIVKQFCHTGSNDVNYRNDYGRIERYGQDTLLLSGIHGIVIYNTQSGRWTLLNNANGLPDIQIQATVTDKNKRYVWINTLEGGICLLDMQTLKVTKPPIAEGNSIIYGASAFLKTSNEDILFSGNGGFTLINPLKYHKSTTEKIITITGIQIGDRDCAVDSILELKNQTITIPEKNSQINIQFSTLDYWHTHSSEYYAWLQNADTGWIYLGNKSEFNVKYLKAGTYKLLLKSKLQNGEFSNKITSITIKITPPFYKTTGFRLLLIFLLLSLLYLLFRWRFIVKKNLQSLKNEQLQSQLEHEKIVNFFANDLINQHSEQAVLWSVARNLISKLQFEDCMLYMWNDDKTKMKQVAGYGPKGSLELIEKMPFDVSPGEGIVGYVIQSLQPVLVTDATQDSRYRMDEMQRLSEICAPIIYENELLGVIDSENSQKNYYTYRHLQLLVTIASLIANKIHAIRTQRNLQNQLQVIEKTNAELTMARLQALQSQMNPHFIFNSLNSIENYILKNDKQMASDYLTKFAKLVRTILDSSRSELVPLHKDIEALEWYVQLEQMRFKNKFSFYKTIDATVFATEYKVPPLLLQPFVENAIIHGLSNSQKNNLHLLLSITKEDNYLKYQISDNGIGRKAAAKIANYKNTKSTGIEVTTQRIKLHNGSTESDSIVITDLEKDKINDSGTQVTIYVKIIL